MNEFEVVVTFRVKATSSSTAGFIGIDCLTDSDGEPIAEDLEFKSIYVEQVS